VYNRLPTNAVYTCQNWISIPNIVLNHWKIHNHSDSRDAINSIGLRRLTKMANERRSKPLTSVFYNVIRLESIRGRWNVLIEGHYWRFFGKFELQNVVGHRADPQKALPCVIAQRSAFWGSAFWAIVRENPLAGHFNRRVQEKIRIKIDKGFIFHVFAQTLPHGRLAQIWVTCSSHGRNQLCKVLS